MKKRTVRTLVITFIYALVVFYIALPAINLRSPSFYQYLISIVVVYFIVSLIGTVNFNDVKNRNVNVRALKLNTKISLGIILVSLILLFGKARFIGDFPCKRISKADQRGDKRFC